jgi:hypothetical protein
MAVTQVTKGLIGKEDLDLGRSTTSRATSTGGTTTINQIGLHTFNQEIFNVKDYGAVGNGATDDTVAIQAAITACEASDHGGTVFLPAGDYYISSTLTIAKRSGNIDQSFTKVNMIGQGRHMSTLQWNGGADECLTVTGDASGNNIGLLFADFGMINSDGLGTRGFDLNFITFSPSLVRLQSIGFLNENFWIENAENVHINSCFAQLGSPGSAIYTDLSTYGFRFLNANRCVMTACQTHGEGQSSGSITSPGAYGVYIEDCDGFHASQLVIEGTATGDLDAGFYDRGGAESGLGAGGFGGNFLNVYMEKILSGVNLAGNDTRDAQNYDINGRIGSVGESGGRGIYLDKCDSIRMDNLFVQAGAGTSNFVETTANATNLHFGQCTWRNVGSADFVLAHTAPQRPIEGEYWQSPIEVTDGTAGTINGGGQNFTGSNTLQDYTGAVISGDFRLPLASYFRIEVVVNTVPAADDTDWVYVTVGTKDGTVDDQVRLNFYPEMIKGIGATAIAAGEARFQAEGWVKAKYPLGTYVWQVNQNNDGWDIDVKILEVARYYG